MYDVHNINLCDLFFITFRYICASVKNQILNQIILNNKIAIIANEGNHANLIKFN